MSEALDRYSQRVTRATQRLMALKTQQLRREMAEQNRARQVARRRDQRRRVELGSAVLLAGCGQLETDELVGLLLDARDRIGSSPTMRMAFRKRGREWMQQEQPAVPPAPT